MSLPISNKTPQVEEAKTKKVKIMYDREIDWYQWANRFEYAPSDSPSCDCILSVYYDEPIQNDRIDRDCFNGFITGAERDAIGQFDKGIAGKKEYEVILELARRLNIGVEVIAK